MDFVPLPKGGRLWKSKADFFRPFRTAAAEAGENIAPLYDPRVHNAHAEEQNIQDLNTALVALVDIFPDVEPEVFREMLLSISEESRVEVVTEHLLQHKKSATWIRGRYRKLQKAEPVVKTDVNVVKSGIAVETEIPVEEMFRNDEYKKAVKQVLYQEFRSLSHSTIKGVMAEQNYSYTMCRPILQQLSTKSWRFSLSGFWPRRAPSASAIDHPSVVWQTSTADGVTTPAIRRTGSAQLDRELYELFVEPFVLKQQQELLTADHAYASQMNETEAEEAEALFDCGCCYGSVPFEQISYCDYDAHQLCFDCVKRTVNEALYGQGWARTADLEKSTVRCFAPTMQDCHGCLPAEVVKRALSDANDKSDAWDKFQSRLASDVLTKSRLRLQQCAFCSYAEVDETPAFKIRRMRDIWHHVVTRCPAVFQIMLLSLLPLMFTFAVPASLAMIVLWLVVSIFPPAAAILEASQTRVYKRRRNLKFNCRNPSCRKISCTRCTAPWRDPHICFETEKTSLRTAIEASATAAIKRTCPKCLLSFVKSSGCNKLVCNCGYTMCYVCRQEITSKEGYAHFCQHFRPSGGRCGECERCDLYGDEDEGLAIRRAAEAAEKAWREKEGGRSQAEGDERATQLMVEALIGQARYGRWYEEWLDAVVDAVSA